MSRVETRAQALGVKPRSLESQTRRKLDRIRASLEGLSYDWSEIDSGISNDLDVVYEKIREIDGDGGTLIDAIERLKAPWGDEA